MQTFLSCIPRKHILEVKQHRYLVPLIQEVSLFLDSIMRLLIQQILFLVFYFIFYCCSVTVIPPFFSVALPCLYPLASYPSPLPQSVLPHCACESLIHVPWLDLSPQPPTPVTPLIPLLPPLWSLSVCSLFPCLWFCFVHLFVLLIRFHL